MIEQGEFYLAMIGLFALYIILNMRYKAKLLDLLDELAFPSDDPIMTSSLKEPVFEYEEEEPEEGESEEEASEEAVELTPEEAKEFVEVMAKEEPEVFSYDEDPKPEVFTEGLETRRTISFFEPDFPPLTLAQLKRLPKAELIDLCEKYGHDTSGTKNDLFKRLVD